MILPMTLCLTHADKENKLSRESYQDQIKNHKDLKHYFDEKKT